MGLETCNKFSDLVNFISPKSGRNYNIVVETGSYLFSFDCNFDLIVVYRGEYGISNYLIKKYKCGHVLIEYDKLCNPRKLYFSESSLGKTEFEFNLSHPLYISKDQRVVYNCDYYISDDVNFIKKYMVDCLNFEVNKKLDEIAAIYNKYGNINKIRL